MYSRLRCESRTGVLKKGDVAAPPRERLNLKHEALRILWINPHSILNDVSAEDFILLVLISRIFQLATPPFRVFLVATLPQDYVRLTHAMPIKKSEGCNQRTLNVYPIRITFLSLSLFRRCLDDFIRLQRYILFSNHARFSALKLLNDAINLHL